LWGGNLQRDRVTGNWGDAQHREMLIDPTAHAEMGGWKSARFMSR
jgi:hypothetical protein